MDEGEGDRPGAPTAVFSNKILGTVSIFYNMQSNGQSECIHNFWKWNGICFSDFRAENNLTVYILTMARSFINILIII